MICPRVAPTARRMPISFVRSITLVTSVFVMPTAATNSAIIAKRFKHAYLVDTPSFESRKQQALERKVGLFGSGTEDIYRFGPRPDLIGERVAGAGGREVDVDRATGFIPTHVAGALPDGRRGGGRVVAVAVNGRVVATGVTFTLNGSDEEQYSVVVPERSLRPGRNRIKVLLR